MKKVDSDKTASAGKAVEVSGMEVEVQILVQLYIGVADGRGGQ